MQIDLSGPLAAIKNIVVTAEQTAFFSDAINFTIGRYRLEIFEADEKNYEQYNNHKENVSNKLSQLQRALSRCNLQEKQIMLSGIRDKFNMPLNDAEVVNTVLDFLQETIKKNTKLNKWKQINGATPKTKVQRVLIARIAGIYCMLGGNDSHTENSFFVELLQSIFTTIGIDSDAVSLLKRAKEQSYYDHFKKNPFPVGSFYYDLARAVGTNNR